MRRNSALMMLVLVAMLLALCSCSSDSSSTPAAAAVTCTTDATLCGSGETCLDGVCVDTPLCTFATDGSLAITADTTMASGVYNYDSFTIAAGATLSFTGTEPVMIYANTVTIDGTLDVTGFDGMDSSSLSLPHGGDGGPGGGGGGGGGDCGNGDGTGGTPGGGAPTPYPGQTYWSNGGNGGNAVGSTAAVASGGDFNYGGGGGGGGASDDGLNGERFAIYSDIEYGYGGDSFSDAQMVLFTGGGGAAGGGANGGGGGGGGGGLMLIADTIVISSTGVVDASGGEGGTKTDGDCNSGGGGGGGGGMLWLEADTMTIDGAVFALAGSGDLDTTRFGGDGADGRIQLSSPVLDMSLGTVDPAPLVRTDGPACPY